MTQFEAITEELSDVTGGNYWSRMHYARAAWAGAYGYPMYPRGMYPRPAPGPCYGGPWAPSPRALWRSYARTHGIWG